MPSGVQHTSTPCGRSSAHSPSAKLSLNAFTAEYTASVAAPARQASDRDQHDAAATTLAHRRREVPRQRDRSDAAELDLLERVLERVVEELDRAVRGSGVVDDQSDVEPLGGLGHPLRRCRERSGRAPPAAPRRRVVRAPASATSANSAPVARDQHEIQSPLGQLVGQARADPLGCACDDRPPAVLLCEFIGHDAASRRRSVAAGCGRDRRRIRHPSGPRTSSSS